MAGTALITDTTERVLTPAEFCRLAEVPPELEWLGNIRNPHTKKAYTTDVKEFLAFVGIRRPEEFCTVTRAHVNAWRDRLEKGQCAGSTLRRKLAALGHAHISTT